MKNNKFNTESFLNTYFYGIDENTLIEMITSYPDEFKNMCILMCLDIQIEKEFYEKEGSSNRRNLC